MKQLRKFYNITSLIFLVVMAIVLIIIITVGILYSLRADQEFFMTFICCIGIIVLQSRVLYKSWYYLGDAKLRDDLTLEDHLEETKVEKNTNWVSQKYYCFW